MKEFTAPQYRLSVVTDYTVLWRNYFHYFQEKEVDRKFTAEEEKEFEDLMTNLAVNQFRFHEAVVPFMKDPREVFKIMQTTPSLKVLHSMSDATFSKTQIDWHTLFIEMNKAIGKLQLIQPKPRK